jgi:uncharacterized membrane protein YphA (DoxX/SURF4 family)
MTAHRERVGINIPPGGVDEPIRTRGPRTSARPPSRPSPSAPPHSRWRTDQVLSDVATTVQAWAPTVARVFLGLVLGWFGYHELVAPELWTGYVPILDAGSSLTQVLVLAHGWVLLVLAVALVAGIAPRFAAAIACLLLLEIVISLTASAGLSDLVLRDVGVLGLAISLLGRPEQRLVLEPTTPANRRHRSTG